MTKVSEDLVRRVSQLARLSLSEEEQRFYVGQLTSIVDYVERLDELDERLSQLDQQAEDVETPERDDVIVNEISLEAALENAPKKVGTAFQVPKIIE